MKEKYGNKLIPKGEKAVQARLLFNYYTDEEDMEHLKKSLTMDWEGNVDKEVFLMLRSLYIKDPDHLKKYYPLKVVKQGNGVLMVDTLYEELFINNQ